MSSTFSLGSTITNGCLLYDNFSPLSLFAAGEQGYWLDPSDFSTMFQDTAGATPVTAVGESVRRWLDKSGRGNHFTQTNVANAPILGREPFGGRRNLLTFTEQFDDAAWIKAGTTITPNVVAAPDGTMTADEIRYSGGGANQFNAGLSTAVTTPITNVLTGLGDISGDNLILRANGTQSASGTADLGTGNYLTYTHYIGRRTSALFPFNGRIYQLITRYGPNLPLSTIIQAEIFTNQRTGAY